ncbi:hypothetical protein B7P43_G06850 [Cryptotermes secundus]|nr:hypothetical protein B7P43_G06850 [Cryptotermes secundus]
MQALQQQMAQLQQQAMTATPAASNKEEVMKLHKELEKAQEDLKNAAVERERFQAQLEMLVQELEKNQLDLHEANKKLANGAARAGEETTALKMQLDEQKKQLEDQRRKLEEHKKGLDSKSRQLEEKEKSIADVDQKLKKRKEKLDQLEAQIQKQSTMAAAGGGGRGDPELQKRLSEMQQELESNHTELEKTREDAQRSQVEMERLLQLVQMSQEEQNTKEKMIRDLQEALKNAQAKLRSQQTANAQLEEQRRREEVEVQDKSVEVNIKEDNVQMVYDLKEVKRNELRITELEQDVCSLEEALTDQHKGEELQGLHEELTKKDAKIMDMEQEICALEAALRDHSHMAELEELVGVVRQKDERIEELEEALRESVRITAEREMVLQEEESCRKQIMEKVGKLEQRLLSLQTAHALRCSTCRPLLMRLQELERRLTQLLAERREHLQDLAQMKQEALEAAISEKDAHLALLEVSGIRTARQAEEADQLHADRRRLMEKLKEENEWSVRLLQEYSEPDHMSLGPSLLDLDMGEDQNCTHSGNHNGQIHQQNEVDQDSLEAVSPNITPPPT